MFWASVRVCHRCKPLVQMPGLHHHVGITLALKFETYRCKFNAGRTTPKLECGEILRTRHCAVALVQRVTIMLNVGVVICSIYLDTLR